jgi:endonuclease YncB( thermonuclease family)
MSSTSRTRLFACQSEILWPALALLLALAPHPATALDAGAHLATAGVAVVGEIVDGDTVRLDRDILGAREVRLVGIQAPKLPLGRPAVREWPFAKEAAAKLARLVQGREVRLGFGGQRLDRHGRLLAHLTRDDGLWIQGALLEAGLARVYSFSDNRALVAPMLEREHAARAARRGIWSHGFFAVRTPDEAAKHINSFELVEGTVLDVASVGGRTYMNFGANWRTDFTIVLQPKAARLFAQQEVKPASYKGQAVRVRGWLQSRDGPMIEATHPEQIEVLDR